MKTSASDSLWYTIKAAQRTNNTVTVVAESASADDSQSLRYFFTPHSEMK